MAAKIKSTTVLNDPFEAEIIRLKKQKKLDNRHHELINELNMKSNYNINMIVKKKSCGERICSKVPRKFIVSYKNKYR